MSRSDDHLSTQARLDAAVPIVGLVLARERATLETDRRLAGELISLILARQVQAAAVRLAAYGLDPNRDMLAIVTSERAPEPALTAAEAWLADLSLPGVVALRGSELYALVEAPDTTSTNDDSKSLASNLAAATGATAAGVGSIAPGLGKLRKSMVQARQACELALRRGGGTVLSHELAGSHSLLLALQDQDVLDAFRDALMTPLEDYDQIHDSHLVTTLRAFLQSGGKWKQTAMALTIHVNTLRYRLEKVEELTGRQLETTNDRVDLWLALQTPTARPKNATRP